MHDEVRHALQAALQRPEAQIDLIGAALLIARIARPALDAAPYARRLARWGRQLADSLDAESDIAGRIAHLNHFMFSELGFEGADEDYYNPVNSFLNEVMDRRRGIPISLALIYMALGRHIGLDLDGVSFPGHFLVKMTVMGGQVVLDPYHRGISLDENDLRRRLQTQYGEAPPELRPLLRRARKRDILVRMLRNLKAIYQSQGQIQHALEASDLILAIAPDLDEEYRDRGLLFYEVDYAPAALEDLRHYLAAHPDAEDAAMIRELIIDLQRESPRLH